MTRRIKTSPDQGKRSYLDLNTKSDGFSGELWYCGARPSEVEARTVTTEYQRENSTDLPLLSARWLASFQRSSREHPSQDHQENAPVFDINSGIRLHVEAPTSSE